MKDLLWKMFELTGELKYYLLFKELEDEDRKSKRNSTK